MPAHARSRLEDRDQGWRLASSMTPHIEAELVADQRQLVGEGDIDVAGRILDQLDESSAVGASVRNSFP